MITEAQRNILKIFLKNNYADAVLSVLLKKGIKSRNKKPYSEAMIYAVFSGRVENSDIEDAIFKVFEERKLKNEKLMQKRQKQLSA